MEEDLFTIGELNSIIEEARNPIYSEPNLLHLGSNKTSIIGVSKANGLTLVYGTEDTGYKHIIERHSLTSRNPYWDDKNKIGNPTKFNLNLAPIEYLYVASQIYKPENINIAKNKNPEKFEVYIGLYKHFDGCEIEYKLILYKGTKIIHTFFINDNKKPFNKKKIVDLRQGWTSASHNLIRCVQTFEIPYYNNLDIEVLKIIVRFFEIEKTEKWYIQVNSEEGHPILTTFIKELNSEISIPMAFRMTQIDFMDIEWIEKIIKQIIDGRYKFE